MPIYNFRCTKCNEEFKKVAKVGTDEIECKNCKEVAKRVFSGECNTYTPGNPTGRLRKGAGGSR